MRRAPEDRASERGVALLVTLFATALLTVLVIEFTYSTQVDTRRTALWAKGRRAHLLAEAGVMLGMELLGQDVRFTGADSLDELWARPLPPLETGGGLIHVAIEDLDGRFDLNRLRSGAGARGGQVFGRLVSAVGLDPGLVGALADWIDRNRLVTRSPEGAEDLYYEALDPPYEPRNGMLASRAELALVRGFDAEALARLDPYVAVSFDDAPRERVNVNTAPEWVLRTVHPALDDPAVSAAIVAARKGVPIRSFETLRQIPGVGVLGERALADLFVFSSTRFRIRATGEVDEVFQSIDAVVERRSASDLRVHYWLARRGPLVAGIDTEGTASLAETELLRSRNRRLRTAP